MFKLSVASSVRKIATAIAMLSVAALPTHAYAEAMPHVTSAAADTFSFFGETIMATLGLGGPDTVPAYKIWTLPFSPYALLIALGMMMATCLCIRRAQKEAVLIAPLPSIS